MVEKEVIAEVKRAWAYYQYAANLCSMYRDQDKMAEELKRIGEIRYQQGEITLLEKNMMTTTAADLHNRWYQARGKDGTGTFPVVLLCRQPDCAGRFDLISLLYHPFGR